jgi:sugar O-acyltransferase (sialic acid O-acetyltransferase NeuD family)
MKTSALPLVLLGAGGHSRVLVALARAAGYPMLGVCDSILAEKKVAIWEDLEVLGDDCALDLLDPGSVALMLGVGQLVGDNLRMQIYASWRARGYTFPTLIHPNTWIAPGVVLNDGVQVMAGAVIQPRCEIGENSIVNTRVGIDHDCRIGCNVHLAPGVTLCGSVTIEDEAFIGAGATVIQGVRVGRNAVVGAGVTLVRDLKSKMTIIGSANRLR